MTNTSAAFFDLDGTLIPGSANIPLAKSAFRQGFIGKTDLLKDLRNGLSFLLKGATDQRSEQVRDRILRAVAGHRAEDVEALGDHFIDDLVASMKPAMREVLDQHGRAGQDRIVISASPTEIVSRLAGTAGLEVGVGTTAARDAAGVYTGELVGPFCYSEGKVQVMRALADERGYDLADCFAYSDSVSDLPMLTAVGHPVAVNPEPELREIAVRRGWPIVETSSVPRVKLTSARGLARLMRNAFGAAGRRVIA
ncbi:MAG: HAD-IB family hydrolase [Candidatus Nanopelagicales bacterium]